MLNVLLELRRRRVDVLLKGVLAARQVRSQANETVFTQNEAFIKNLEKMDYIPMQCMALEIEVIRDFLEKRDQLLVQLWGSQGSL